MSSPAIIRSVQGVQQTAERRPYFRRVLDFVFGYDFFISYAWTDGARYAEQLARRLEQNGYDVFLDRDDYAGGDDWQSVGSWTLRRTGQLILIGSPRALESDPVAREVEIFAATGRRIVPIEFDGSLENVSASSRLAPHLPPQLLRVKEPVNALSAGPSDETLAFIRRTFTIVRQDKKRIRVLGAVAIALAIMAIAAAAFGVIATRSAAAARNALAEAEMARNEAVQQRDSAIRAQRGEAAAKVDAQVQRNVAQDRQAEAERQRELAQQRQLEAERERSAAVAAREAERQARIAADRSAREARAQADASTAYIYSDRDPTLALRLATRATEASPNATADLALLRAYNSGSWFYSHRFRDADDASLSTDERRLAWVKDKRLHVLDLTSGQEQQWEDGGSEVQFASNGNIATWSFWHNEDGRQVLKVRAPDGRVLLDRTLHTPQFRRCGRDALLATGWTEESNQVRRLQVLRVRVPQAAIEQIGVLDSWPAESVACTDDSEIIVAANFDEAMILRGDGTHSIIHLPTTHHASDVAITPGGMWAAVYLSGAVRDETDALALINLDQRNSQAEVVALPASPSFDSGGSIIFLDTDRLLAVSTDGWAKIVDVHSKRLTSLGEVGRAADRLAVFPHNGDFIIARRSGRATIYNKDGRIAGILLGTPHSDGLNPAFSRVEAGSSGNSILTVSRTDGAHLWRRPRLSVMLPARRIGKTWQDDPLASDLLTTVASGPPDRMASTCGGTNSLLRDDAGLLYLCVRMGGRMDLLPSYLRSDDIQVWLSSDDKVRPVQYWGGERMQRLFIMSPQLILKEVVDNQNIWPVTSQEIDRIFQERPGR